MWIFVALAICHRPLLHFAVRRVAIRIARSQHMALDLRVGGNLWTAISLTGISVMGDASGKAPVERLKLDRVEVRYDLWKAVRGEWRRVLRRVDLGKLDGVVALQPSAPETAGNDPTLADTLRAVLSNSLSPVEHLAVQRVDLEVRDVAAIRGLRAEVNDGRPGYVAWDGIHIAGLPDFVAARADLLMSDSQLELRGLPLIPSFELKRLSLNRVTATLPRGGLEIAARIGGGGAGLRIEPAPSGPDLIATVEADNVGITELAALFGTPLPVGILLDRFQARFTGAPEKLENSSAAVSFAVHSDGAAGSPPLSAHGDAVLERGLLRITEITAVAPGVESRISGAVNIPLKGFAPARITGQIDWTLAAPDLIALKFAGAPAMNGSAKGSGLLRFAAGEAQAEGGIEVSQLAVADLRIDAASVRIRGTRRIDTFADVLTTLSATAAFDAKGVVAHGVKVDSLVGEAKVVGRRLGIETLKITSGENVISATAVARLKPGAAGLDGPPEIEFTVNAPRLEQFGIAVNGAALAGNISAQSKLRLEGGRLAGSLQAAGADVRLGGVPAGGFQADVTFAEGEARLDSLRVDLAGAGDVTAKGRVGLAGAMPYSGEFAVKLRDLSKLRALAGAAGHAAEMAGSLAVEWLGKGEILPAKHDGSLKVSGDALKHDAVRIDEVRLDADYSPAGAETRELRVVAGKARLEGKVAWREGRLSLAGLKIAMNGGEVLSGDASFPLAPGGPRGLLPDDQPITARFKASNADIGRLAGSFGIAAPVSGSVSADAVIDGTLSKPGARVNIAVKSLKSAEAPALAPAEVELKLTLADSRATLSAVARQRDIQPLTASASLPLDIGKLRAEPGLVRGLPVQASVKLPATSLGIVPRFVPAISKLDGTVAANIEITGTVDRPVVKGDVALSAKSLRMANGAIPPLSNFTSKIIFSGDTATVSNTRGETGGGTFNVTGTVKLADLAQPVFDLRLRSDKVLVMRDESITVRADTDLALAGPLNSARASGTVFVTQSRFSKDVEILPLSLPGRPKRQVRAVSAPLRVSFPNPPLRDWTFDIAIKTREKDPFLVRGNLAKGSAALDLRLGGSGLNPFLTGSMQIQEFRAVLPASTFEVTRGFVTFTADEPFAPRIDLQGQTRIGRNTITASVSGPALAPRLELESEPPLPQRDILSLLATGTTTSDIGSNTGALASNAALLTVKRWYRKVFKRDAPEDGSGSSLLDRFELDVGSVDPKTGRPEVTGSLQVTDSLFFLGEIDIQGQTIGRVKYLLRFR